MNLGIIGSGMIVQDFLNIADLIDDMKLEAILGREKSLEKINHLVNKYNINKTYYDYDELLNDSNIDTLYIAVPNHLHFEFTKKALDHKKHVICEKPFTSNLEELKELIALAKQNNCLLFEAITNQYLPVYQKIKKQLSSIGKISIISCNFSQYSSRYDDFKNGIILPVFDVNKSGGALMDLNVYNIHFVVGLFGKPEHVHYYANIEHGIDTSGVLCLSYPNFEAVCIAAKDCSAPISTTIQGDKGCIKVDGPVSVLSDVQILKNTENSEQMDTGNYHRMYSEFKAFTTYIDNLDFEACNKMLEQSYIVMDVLTQARKSANIVFGAEKHN